MECGAIIRSASGRHASALERARTRARVYIRVCMCAYVYTYMCVYALISASLAHESPTDDAINYDAGERATINFPEYARARVLRAYSTEKEEGSFRFYGPPLRPAVIDYDISRSSTAKRGRRILTLSSDQHFESLFAIAQHIPSSPSLRSRYRGHAYLLFAIYTLMPNLCISPR